MVLIFLVINLLLESIQGALILLKGPFFQVVVEAASITFQISSLTEDCRHTVQVTSCLYLMYMFLLVIDLFV